MTETALRIVLGGVRGSMPLSHPDFMRFGGATTSALVDDGAGARIVFDAGSGLRTLQPLLEGAADLPVLMLFTHYHLDHLIGLPPFAPLYDPGWHILFAAPPCEGVTAEQAIHRLIDKPFWPVPFRAQQRFLVLPDASGETPLEHGPFRVRWCPVHHNNGCHAYRVDEQSTGASMVFATDLEWSSSSAEERERLLRLCREPGPVDVLIMEGHDDTEGHTGWGHSTWQEAVQVAQAAQARQLVVTHLAPTDDDAVLAAREQRVQAAMPHACLGKQGMQIAWQKQATTR